MGIRPKLSDFNEYIADQSFRINLFVQLASESRAEAKKIDIVDTESYEEFKMWENKGLEACKEAQRCISNVRWGNWFRSLWYPIKSGWLKRVLS